MPVNHLKSKGDLTRQVWVKLAGNASANYGAAIQDQTIPELYADPKHGEFYKEIIAEVLRVGLDNGLPAKFERMIPKVVNAIVKAKSNLTGHFTSTHASYQTGVADCEHSVIVKPVLAMAKASGRAIQNTNIASDNFLEMLRQRDEISRAGKRDETAANQARKFVMGSN